MPLVNGKAREKDWVWQRRQEVIKLRLKGVRAVREIATELKVHPSTISRDCIAVDEEFRRQSAANLQAEKGLDLARLDRLIEAVWDTAIGGDLGAIKVVADLLNQRADLLGIKAPSRLDLRVSRMDDDEVKKELLRRLQELARNALPPAEGDIIDADVEEGLQEVSEP
jgi:hypothetical protein